MPLCVKRRDESLNQASCQVGRLRGVGDLIHENDELVAAEPRQRVVRPKASLKAVREQDQDVVADGMAEAVVDHLEPVAVLFVDVDSVGGALWRREERIQPLQEVLAVRETGEGVAEGLALDLPVYVAGEPAQGDSRGGSDEGRADEKDAIDQT